MARLTKLTHLHYNQFFLSIFFSTSGSLSSLESFGHVDDLDLSKLQLLEAAKSNLSDTNSTTLTSNSEVDDSSSTDADYEISQKQHQSFTDSWV